MSVDRGIQKGKKKTRKVDFTATLHACMGMSYSHFPLILPGVHPLVAPLIMFRLKRRGFSNCRVEVSGSGLVVYADR
jgi:hypothetical protein